jgi:CRP-like cAMP-binding protein
MREIVGPRRVAALRSFPGFAALSVEDITALSALAEERTFRRGASLARAGSERREVLLVLEGDVRVRRPSSERVVGARDIVGLLELLAGDPDGLEAVAESETRALAVSREALFEFFDDSFAAQLVTLRALARLLVRRLGGRASLEALPLPARTPPRFSPARPLDYAERLLVLSAALVQAPRRIEATAELARVAVWERHAPGARLWQTGEAAGAAVAIVAGELVATLPSGASRRFGPGTVIGGLEALGGVPRWFRAEAHGELALLRIARDDTIDVLEDHGDLALDVLRTMATVLLRIDRFT